ncbi:acetyl-CoA carboxylase biotin carboxyl carrier protein [Laceyella putida]|uniref:Biotin carboxyl carrier protein of acetyl-CoA carboxylase n=1 Tax=Laceyella putida TaxID=110101 RepID=A0ABW2RJ05_9BACL
MMAFKMHEIRELIRLIDESSIEEFEIDNDGTKITIKKAGERAVAVASQAPANVVATPPAPEAPLTAPQAPVTEEAPQVAASAKAEENVDDANLHKIVSPMVGTFYRAPAPDADPYVKEGDTVNAESVVCIVEAMKLMNEIEAEVRGTIVKVLVENGQLVEFGQPLFLVKTS